MSVAGGTGDDELRETVFTMSELDPNVQADRYDTATDEADEDRVIHGFRWYVETNVGTGNNITTSLGMVPHPYDLDGSTAIGVGKVGVGAAERDLFVRHNWQVSTDATPRFMTQPFDHGWFGADGPLWREDQSLEAQGFSSSSGTDAITAHYFVYWKEL